MKRLLPAPWINLGQEYILPDGRRGVCVSKLFEGGDILNAASVRLLLRDGTITTADPESLLMEVL